MCWTYALTEILAAAPSTPEQQLDPLLPEEWLRNLRCKLHDKGSLMAIIPFTNVIAFLPLL